MANPYALNATCPQGAYGWTNLSFASNVSLKVNATYALSYKLLTSKTFYYKYDLGMPLYYDNAGYGLDPHDTGWYSTDQKVSVFIKYYYRTDTSATTTSTSTARTTTTTPSTSSTTSTITTTTTTTLIKCWSANYQYLYGAANQYKKFCKCATGTYGYNSYNLSTGSKKTYRYADAANNNNWNTTYYTTSSPVYSVKCLNGVGYDTNKDYYR